MTLASDIIDMFESEVKNGEEHLRSHENLLKNGYTHDRSETKDGMHHSYYHNGKGRKMISSPAHAGHPILGTRSKKE